MYLLAEIFVLNFAAGFMFGHALGSRSARQVYQPHVGWLTETVRRLLDERRPDASRPLPQQWNPPDVPPKGPSQDSPLYSDVCNGDGREFPRDYLDYCHHGKRLNDCDVCLAMADQPGR